MGLFSRSLLAIVLLFQTISVDGGLLSSLPDSSDNSDGVESNSYHFKREILNAGEECRQLITVSGKGISDTFYVSCEYDDHFVIHTDDLLLYHHKVDSFFLLSIEPNQLVVIEEDQCTKREYSTVGGKTKSTPASIEEDDCDKLRERIENEEEGRGSIGGLAKSLLSVRNGFWRLFSPISESKGLLSQSENSPSDNLSPPVKLADRQSASDVTFQVHNKKG